MSSPTRKRGERGEENAEDCDRATQPSPTRQRTDGSGDNGNSERCRSATSRLWQVLYDLRAFIHEEDIEFQPEAFLAAIEVVLCNNKDEVDYRVRIAARSILSSRIFHQLFKRIFMSDIDNSDPSREEDDQVDELCLLPRIDSLRLEMIRGEKDGPVDRLRLIDGIVSHILVLMWKPKKDWSVDKLCLIEHIVTFILHEINVEEDDQLDFLCQTKQIVSFIGEIIGEKNTQIDKLDLIQQIGFFINRPTCNEGDYYVPKAHVMMRIAAYLYEGLLFRKDKPVYGLNLIERTVSFFLDVKRAEKNGQDDKLCLIERIISFIDDIIREKDGQVDKLRKIEQIVNLFFAIDVFDRADRGDILRLMNHIVTLSKMIKGEKDGQVDKLSIMEQMVTFFGDGDNFMDKLKLMQHIISLTKKKLLGHGSSRSVEQAFNGELEARNRETELLTEAPTQDMVRDTLKGYKGRSKCMQYFTRQEGNKWLCNLCGKDTALEIKVLRRNKDGTTTPFLRHLKKFHIKEYNEIRDAMKQKNKRQTLNPTS